MNNKFAINVRVYYEDTDAGGVVYHSNYLNYYERCRTEWLRSLGYQQNELTTKLGVIFVVKNVAIDYLKPAKFDDELIVSAQVVKQSKASMVFEQTITTSNNKEQLVNKASVVIVCVDAKTFKTTAIPKQLSMTL